jgi:hypothetical protein
VNVDHTGGVNASGALPANDVFYQLMWKAVGPMRDGPSTAAALERFFWHELPQATRGAYSGRLVQGSASGAPNRYRINMLPDPLTPNTVLAQTLAGRLIWTHAKEGGSFKAGGWGEDGSEMWLTLSEQPGRKFLFVVTEGLQVRSITRQRDFLFWRCTLSKLHAAIVPENTPG